MGQTQLQNSELTCSKDAHVNFIITIYVENCGYCAGVLEEPAAPPSSKNMMCRQPVLFLRVDILKDVAPTKRVFDAVQTTELTTTNSTEQSSSSEGNSSSSSHEIPRILWNSNVRDHIHKRPQPVLVVRLNLPNSMYS